MNNPKNHHYVPQFLLKQFSQDKKNINLCILKSGQLKKGPIRTQCSQRFLHGKTPDLELAFSKMEADFATILRKLERGAPISNEDKFQIRFFINYQIQRTKEALDELNEIADQTAKLLIQHNPKLKDIDPAKYTIKLTDPFIFSMRRAISTTPLLLDLGMRVLQSKRELEFLTSDNPAVLYNQFIEHDRFLKNRGGATGLALKGLQIFMPISPRLTLFLFDSSTYRVGNDTLYTGLSNADIKTLNKLQAAYAEKCVYALDFSKVGISIEKLVRAKANRAATGRNKFQTSAPRKLPDGKTSKLIVNSRLDVRLDHSFSFCEVIDRTDYRNYNIAMLPVRSWEAVQAQQKYEQFLEQMIEEKIKEKGIQKQL